MTTAVAPNAFAIPTPTLPMENPTLLNLLIVDDQRSVREACRDGGAALGYHTRVAESAEQAEHLMDFQPTDVILLDLKLTVPSDIQVLRHIKDRHPDVEVIVMTSQGSVESAVHAIQAGAYDYITKPFGMEQLNLLLERLSLHLQRKTESRARCERLKSKRGFGSIVGRTPEMEKLYRIIAKVAYSTHPVLVLGESGTGKEMVARAIHYSGPLRDQPFIPVDCGSLVPSLIESELFGYVKGAFTGAAQSKAGLLAIAEGGTVFLDEVGELPVDLQARLLRTLQEKEIRPVGSTQRIPINVRILAATNRNLEEAVAKGQFRQDLYFRLNVLSLRIPPLRERRQDIPLLVASSVEHLSRPCGRRLELSDDAMKALLAYDWPGNVRELENCMERCCAMTSGPIIHTGDLPAAITGAQPCLTAAPETRILPIAELEKRAILSAIKQLNGDKLMAAKLLGIGKTTLYRKLKEYGALV